MFIATFIFCSLIFTNQAIAEILPILIPKQQLEIWCLEAGGKWLEKSCEWHQLDMDINQEQGLEKQCKSYAGIWQTITDDIIGPSFCGNSICTMDAVIIGHQEKGVGCVWYPDF